VHRRFELASLRQAIIEQLERVQRRETDRLMISSRHATANR
jgi:hypothetical protein